MSQIHQQKSGMAKDTLAYMVAKAIEGLAGIIALNVYTNTLGEETFGIYNFLNTLIVSAAMLSIQWLSQSIYRYMNHYEINHEHKPFYSTAFYLWLSVNLIFFLLAGTLIISLRTVFSGSYWAQAFTNIYSNEVLFYGVLMFITYNTWQILTALLAAKRAIKLNLVLSVFSVVGKLACFITLNAFLGAHFKWIFISSAIFDGFVSIVACIRLKLFGYVSFQKRSSAVSKQFRHYGTPLVGNLFTSIVLSNSDRLILTPLTGFSTQGTYTANYSIVSSAFTMLQAAVMRGTYPTILRAWSEGKKDSAIELITDAVRGYLILSVPAILGVYALSNTIAATILQEDFVKGSHVMPWIALGLFLYGLTEYSNKPWELSGQTKYIFRNSFIGGAINIAINVAFIPRYGYMVAAYSTFIGYLVYFLLSKLGSRKYIRWNISVKVYARIIGSAFMMAAALKLALFFMTPTKFMLIFLVLLGIIVYGFCLYVSGEIKKEVHFVISRLKRNKNTGS